MSAPEEFRSVVHAVYRVCVLDNQLGWKPVGFGSAVGAPAGPLYPVKVHYEDRPVFSVVHDAALATRLSVLAGALWDMHARVELFTGPRGEWAAYVDLGKPWAGIFLEEGGQ